MSNTPDKEKIRLRPDMLTKGEFIAAAILVAVLVPVTRMAGSMCAGYLSVPLILYFFSCGIFLVSFERSVCKMVKFRIKRDQYQNALSLFKKSLLIAFIIDLVLCVILASVAYVLMDKFFYMERGYIILWLVLPAILCVSVQGCIRGYLHGMGYTIQNFVSMLIMSISSLIISVVLSFVANSYGEKVNALLHVDYVSRFYTACVCMIGFSIGAFLSLLYIVSIYGTKKREIAIFVKTGATRYLESKNEVLEYLMNSVPIMLIMCLVGLVNIRLYLYTTESGEFNSIYISELGVLIGMVMPVVLITVFVMLIPYVKKWYQIEAAMKKGKKEIASVLYSQLSHSMVRAFAPVTFFVMFMSDILQEVIYGKTLGEEPGLLSFSAVLIIITGIFIFLQWFVIRLENTRLLMIGLIIFAVVNIIASLFFMLVLHRGLHAIVLSFIISMLVFDIVFYKLIGALLGYGVGDFARPVIALASGLVAAIVAFLCKIALRYVIGEILTLAACIVVSYVIYILILTLLHGVDRHSLMKLPLGKFFIKMMDANSRRYSE
ncbi:MAG: hypothetical protein K6A23_02520 [Butyrivibrio sp.]|nr:hypothetical protein [Butyrivibrio sp.]